VLDADAGDATIGGFSLRKNPAEVRSLIGSVSPGPALYEELSALDNLIFFGRMEGLDGKEARSQAMNNLALMELTERPKEKSPSSPADETPY